jgi:hypothetical protein
VATVCTLSAKDPDVNIFGCSPETDAFPVC